MTRLPNEIDDLPGDTERDPDVVATDVIRADVGHTFESDGFDPEVARDAINEIESNGYTDAFWYTSESVRDSIVDHIVGDDTVEDPTLTDGPVTYYYPVYVGPDDAFDAVDEDELFLIGKGAVVTPPIHTPGYPAMVRTEQGVAVVHV